jgi:hypothetical protein
MFDRNRPNLCATAERPTFGRRAEDRGFSAPTAQWFGRRAGDRKAKPRHSLPFAIQVAAQIAPMAPQAEPKGYAGMVRTIRSGLVKDFKA